jgi:hypothetical protein
MCLETKYSNGLTLCWVAEKLQQLIGETLEGPVATCCLQKGILLPHSCEAWL